MLHFPLEITLCLASFCLVVMIVVLNSLSQPQGIQGQTRRQLVWELQDDCFYRRNGHADVLSCVLFCE